MKHLAILLALFTMCCGNGHTAPETTNSASTNRSLIIGSSSMAITGGKVTLIIGTLELTNGIYAGDYKIKVSPYFYKNEKGRLAIVVSNDSLVMLSKGKAVAITGTATTSGSKGKSRHIDATATPTDINSGKLKLWFASGDGKMVFEPAYRFGDKTAVSAQKTQPNLAADSKLP